MKTNISSNERIVSLASGAVLLGYGLYRRDTLGVASILLSAALWDRGITGHCAVYAMMGRNSAEHLGEPQQQVHAKYALTIDRSHEDIYERFSAPESLSNIINGGETPEIPGESTSTTDGISRIAAAHEFSGIRDGSALLEITSRGENRLEWRQPMLLGRVELRKAPGNKGTEVEVTLRPDEMVEWIQPFVAFLARRKLRRGLRQLKQELESGDVPTIVGQSSGRSGGRDLRGGITFAELTSLI
jgi:uncharacterized membrane protein